MREERDEQPNKGPFRFDPSPFAGENLPYLLEIGEISAHSGVFTSKAREGSQLLLLTIAGRGGLSAADGDREKLLPLQENFYTWTDGSEVHEFAAEEGWRFLLLRFGGGSTEALRRLRTGGPVSPANPDMRRRLASLLSLCARRTPGRSEGKTLAFELECGRRIFELLTDLLLAELPAERPSRPAFLSEILAYLEDHCREDISLELLSERFHVNKYHLSRVFKSCVGTGYREYLIRLRLDYAREELEHTDRPVSDIAEGAGFPSSSYFIGAFRKAEGSTPLAYRQKHRRENG